MRYFFSFLLGLVLLFPAYSQTDSTVCIKPSTARYYLETEDEMYVLREKDSLNIQLITNLGDQLLVKDQIIDTYKVDSVSYHSRYVTLEAVSTLKDKRIKKLEGNLRLRKALEILAAIGIVVISIL